MDIIERKARFTEIVTTIALYDEDSEEAPRFPNNTAGLADPKLRSALVAHAFAESEEFSNKLVNALMGSAVTSMSEHESCPTEDDLSALTLASSIAWAHGEMKYLLNICGLVGMLSIKHDFDMPQELLMIFRPNEGATGFGKFNPYDIMEGKITEADLDIKTVKERLTEELGEEGLADLKEQIVKEIMRKMEVDKDNE
jgi:hypothetical protein